MSEDEIEDIKALMRSALDEAFQAQIKQLYSVFLANAPSVASQPEYTKAGLDKAIEAYRKAIAAVEDWEG